MGTVIKLDRTAGDVAPVKELRDTDWLMRRLGVTSRGTIHCWVHRKQIPFVRIAPRVVRFDPDEIERWLEARRVSQAP